MTTFQPRKTTTERLRIENSRGLELAALLERPAGTPRLFAVVAHCFTCSKDFPAVAHVSRGLAARGIAALRLDFTGLGGSQGTFEESSFSTGLDDVASVARYLREHERAPALLVGHSWGGAASLAVAGELEEVRAIATIAAPSTPSHVLQHFPSEVEAAREGGSARIAIAGRGFDLTRQFIEDVETIDFQERLARLDRGVLVMHSPSDDVVSIEHAERIYKAVRGPRSFVSLPDSDHVLSRREDADYAAAMIATWVQWYV